MSFFNLDDKAGHHFFMALAMAHGHGLQGREPVQRLEPLFTSIARGLHAVEGQLNAAYFSEMSMLCF